MNKNLKPVIAVASVSLALSLSFTALVGCQNGSGDGDETTTLPSIYDSTTADPAGTSDPSESSTEESTEESTEPVYTEVNETVYVTVYSVNVRKGPGREYESVGVASEGDSYTRIKYNENWSVVLVDGEEFYISSDCLSTELPSATDLTFNAIDKTIYVTVEKVNLRTKPDIQTSEITAVAVKDQALVAIGLSEDGSWYKINYVDSNNKEHVLYVSASCVTTEVAGSDFTEVTKQVRVLVEQLNVRTYPSTKEGQSIKIGLVTKDDIVDVIGVSPDGKWYMIKYTPENGTEGNYFISAGSDYVADVESSTTTEEVTSAEGTTETQDPAGTEDPANTTT